jgi:hypothetical protein
MSEIEISGINRLDAQELIDLAALEHIDGARVISGSAVTGRAGAFPELTAIIPYVQAVTPMLLTVWALGKAQIEFELCKTAKNGKKTCIRFVIKKDDPSKVLRSIKDFLTAEE